MTLNPDAPIFEPKNRSRLLSINRSELLIAMDASTSEDITDPIVPAKCLKTSWDSNSPTVSEQIHLLTTEVDQLRVTSEQALEQTKPLIQTLPLDNIRQLQYIHAAQQQVAEFFVDLNIEKCERLKLCTTNHRLEYELAQLRRQVNEPSPSSLPIPLAVYQPCSTAFEGNCAQISKLSITITLKKSFKHYIQIPAA